MLIWCDVNEKIAVAGLIWGRKKHQGRSWTGSIPAHWAQWTAHSWGASQHHCQLAAAVGNIGEFVGNLQIFGQSPKLRASGSHCLVWQTSATQNNRVVICPPPLSNHYPLPGLHAIQTTAKRWPPSPQNIVQNIKSVLYLVFWFWISLGLVTPFVDLVSRIRTKGLCAALVWIHLTFSRGFTQFANYKNCKYLDQKIYKNDIVHILCS